MVFGIGAEVYKNLKEQQILHIKNTDQYYFLNEKESRQTGFLKTNILNAISISIVLGMFFEYGVWLYVLVAAAIYVGYLIFYNTKVLPALNKAKGKDITRTPQKNTRDKRQQLISGICYLAIGVGLVYCIVTGQAEGAMMKPVAICGTAVAFFFGLRMIMQAGGAE